MVGISPATRHATPDQSMGIPPPPRLCDHAYCRWLCRVHRGRRVPLVRRLRMGSLLLGSWGAEPRGWLLVHHYRSLRTSPSPRATTSPRLTLPLTVMKARPGRGRGHLGCHCGSITFASGCRVANRSERPGNSRGDDRRGRLPTAHTARAQSAASAGAKRASLGRLTGRCVQTVARLVWITCRRELPRVLLGLLVQPTLAEPAFTGELCHRGPLLAT